MKTLKLLASLSALLLALMVPALADQIVIGGSAQNVTFTGGGVLPVNVDLGGGTLSGSAYLELGGVPQLIPGFVPYSFVTTTCGGCDPIQLTGSPNVFGVDMNGNTVAFSFASGDLLWQLLGDVTFTLVKDGTDRPQFVGLVTVTGVGTNLASLFPVSSTPKLDFTLALGGITTIDDVWTKGGDTTALGPVSSGELVPVPEPSTTILVGFGLLAVGRFLRKKASPR